jgi:hypothetical protein
LSVLAWMQWLEATPVSTYLRESLWTYPIIESVHVLSLALFLGFAILLDLRLLGMGMRHVKVSELTERILPWTTAGAVIMVASGILLFIGDPAKFYGSIFMRIKFLMLGVAVLNAWFFHHSADYLARLPDWDGSMATPMRAKVAASVSILMWFLIVAMGRWIAYFLPA